MGQLAELHALIARAPRRLFKNIIGHFVRGGAGRVEAVWVVSW